MQRTARPNNNNNKLHHLALPDANQIVRQGGVWATRWRTAALAGRALSGALRWRSAPLAMLPAALDKLSKPLLGFLNIRVSGQREVSVEGLGSINQSLINPNRPTTKQPDNPTTLTTQLCVAVAQSLCPSVSLPLCLASALSTTDQPEQPEQPEQPDNPTQLCRAVPLSLCLSVSVSR